MKYPKLVIRALLKARRLSVVRYKSIMKNIVAHGLTSNKGILLMYWRASFSPRDAYNDAIIGSSSLVSNLSKKSSSGMMIIARTPQMIVTMEDVW